MDRWIRPSEILPETGESILFYCCIFGRWVLYGGAYFDDKFYPLGADWGFEDSKVGCWCYAPKLPEWLEVKSE